jgi:hypothetical protein
LAGLPHRRPAAPPVLQSPEVASTGANSKRSSTNFFLRTTFIACIAASGMVGTYAIHFQSNLFMLEFCQIRMQQKTMSKNCCQSSLQDLDPGRNTTHLSLAIGSKDQLHWPKSGPSLNSTKINQVCINSTFPEHKH